MGSVVNAANSREHKLPSFEKMSALAEEPPRRISSFSPQVSQENGDRKPSLRELPSYRKEANQALNRREGLKSLSQRLSSNRDLLNADPSTKPWLKFRSISRTENLAKVREDAGHAFPIDEGTFTATPATITPTPPTTPNGNGNLTSWRSRNVSSDANSSSEINSLNDSIDE